MKPTKMILTAGPSITDKEINYTADAVRNGWNENWSDYIKKFERKFAELIGSKYAISTSSCTGAMHLSLLAAGVKSGDEVIVPDLTWVATGSVVTYTGAVPVFVDVNERTWTLDPKCVIPAITKRTKAIMPVHLYGHPTDMGEILSIAEHYQLKVIEDAAPAIGATCRAQLVGSFGDIGTFSFQGAKMVATGEGGMLVTDNEKIYRDALQLSDHGRSPKNNSAFWVDRIGYKYKLSNMQAAFGLAQIERIEELIDKKRQIFDWYQRRLGKIDGLALNEEAEWAKSTYWMTSIYLKKSFPITRDELINRLKDDMIDTRPVFPKISNYPMWPEYNNPIAQRISQSALNLPSGHNLTEEQIEYICLSIRRHLGVD